MTDDKKIDFINEMALLILEVKRLEKDNDFELALDDENISAHISERQYSLKNGLLEVTYALGSGDLTIEFNIGHYSFNPDDGLKISFREWLDDTRAKIEKVKSKKGGEVK